MRFFNSGSGNKNLCNLENPFLLPLHTSVYTSLKRQACCPPLGERPLLTLPSPSLYSQPFSCLILFQEITSEHHTPAITFFSPSLAALQSHGFNSLGLISKLTSVLPSNIVSLPSQGQRYGHVS